MENWFSFSSKGPTQNYTGPIDGEDSAGGSRREIPIRRFWMVWSPQGFPPTYKHSSYTGAINEAKRLARAYPGREYYVLAGEKLVTCESPVTVETLV